MTDRVFAYGTLKRGHPNHAIVSAWVAEARGGRLEGYRLFDCGAYPAARAEAGAAISGEVLWLRDPEAALRALDAYEGEEYRRERASVRVGDGEVEAWVYVLAAPPGPEWRRLAGDTWDERGREWLPRQR